MWGSLIRWKVTHARFEIALPSASYASCKREWMRDDRTHPPRFFAAVLGFDSRPSVEVPKFSRPAKKPIRKRSRATVRAITGLVGREARRAPRRALARLPELEHSCVFDDLIILLIYLEYCIIYFGILYIINIYYLFWPYAWIRINILLYLFTLALEYFHFPRSAWHIYA